MYLCNLCVYMMHFFVSFDELCYLVVTTVVRYWRTLYYCMKISCVVCVVCAPITFTCSHALFLTSLSPFVKTQS